MDVGDPHFTMHTHETRLYDECLFDKIDSYCRLILNEMNSLPIDSLSLSLSLTDHTIHKLETNLFEMKFFFSYFFIN